MPPSPATAEAAQKTPVAAGHSHLEDLLALLTGTLFVSFGIALFKNAGLLTGSTAGIAFLAHYSLGVPFGAVFFAINLPFYYFAFRKMGWRFTARSFAAVALVSAFSELHRRFIDLGSADPFYTAVFGGLLMGVGFIVLFRHQASLGGINVLALYLQDRHGWRAGKVQMAVDVAILLSSLVVVSPLALAASIAGAVAMNLVIWQNHRRDRYVGWSAP
jgi:uncharacterized membrane-anchored protein YitT (DUF2179 family)